MLQGERGGEELRAALTWCTFLWLVALALPLPCALALALPYSPRQQGVLGFRLQDDGCRPHGRGLGAGGGRRRWLRPRGA